MIRREAPHSRPPLVTVDDWETQRVFGDGLYCRVNCQRKLLAERRAHIVVPSPRFFHVRLRQPYDRQLHGFLNTLALTHLAGEHLLTIIFGLLRECQLIPEQIVAQSIIRLGVSMIDIF